MIRRFVLALVAMLAAAVVSLPASADQKSDAVALMNDALAHFQKVGADQAFKDFADPKAGFIRGALYVVVLSAADAKMVAHATNAKLNGMPQIDMKDANGKLFNREMFDGIKKTGEYWVDFQWANPETKKIAPKHSYYKKVSDYLFGVGYYD